MNKSSSLLNVILYQDLEKSLKSSPGDLYMKFMDLTTKNDDYERAKSLATKKFLYSK